MPIATIITKKTKRLAVMFSFFFFSSRFNVSYVQQCINELVSFLFFFSLPINVLRIHCTLFISIKLRFFSFFFLAFYVFTIIQCSVCTTNCSSMRAIHEFSSLHFSIAFKPIHFFQLFVSLLIHYWRSFIADNHCNKFWSKEFPNFLFFSSFLSVCFELKRKKKNEIWMRETHEYQKCIAAIWNVMCFRYCVAVQRFYFLFFVVPSHSSAHHRH